MTFLQFLNEVRSLVGLRYFLSSEIETDGVHIHRDDIPAELENKFFQLLHRYGQDKYRPTDKGVWVSK